MTAPRFHVSSYCDNGGCVAVAISSDETITVRDEKHADAPVLSFTAAEWDAFVAGVKGGEFDRAALKSLRAV
jgi:hypothetical protein